MTNVDLASALRAAIERAREQRRSSQPRHKSFREDDFPDDAPEPPGDPFPAALPYGHHRCVCGGATKRTGSNWWCSNPKYHLSRPAEVDR